MHHTQGLVAHTRGIARYTRTLARAAALVMAVSFAVVGIAAPSSAHHNTITGSVTCATGGGWAVTWTVVNSETVTETITRSNRSVVPVGTTLTSRQVRTFSETITTRPTTDVTLELAARWDNGNTNTSRGTIPAVMFTVNCVQPPTVPVIDDCGPGNARYGQVPTGPWTVTFNPDRSLTVRANAGHQFPNGQTVLTFPVPADSNQPCPVPVQFLVTSVPVIDDCGPGNARYGQIPTGPWTVTINPDRSLTVRANAGHQFPNGQTVLTFPAPVDSNQPCPVVTPPVVTPPVVTPPVVTPPVVTPPVVRPPEVLPAQVRLVKAEARSIDKCGRSSDLFKVAKRSGVVYTSAGKVLRQGVWIKARTGSVTVRAQAADSTVQLQGKQVWKMSFSNKACAQAPQIAPNTGS